MLQSPPVGVRFVAAAWRIGVTTIVLPAGHSHANALRAVLDQLVGPGSPVMYVWVWDVRAL
jgi:hypothetical protein